MPDNYVRMLAQYAKAESEVIELQRQCHDLMEALCNIKKIDRHHDAFCAALTGYRASLNVGERGTEYVVSLALADADAYIEALRAREGGEDG